METQTESSSVTCGIDQRTIPRCCTPDESHIWKLNTSMGLGRFKCDFCDFDL